jgi:hypothetical protein
MPRKRTIVYVDGFNLYYGALKGTRHKWLNLETLCQNLLPKDEIVEIKYFTAHVVPRKDNPTAAQEQQTYLRALRTVSCLSIHLGRFLTTRVTRRLVKDPRRGSPFRQVWNTEEKGSDVNLASHLITDGFRARYDLAVVISNDSDLKHPIHMVRHDLGAAVGILNPHKGRSWALSPPELPLGSFYKPIRSKVLAASQFPATLTDEKGTFSKPADW